MIEQKRKKIYTTIERDDTMSTFIVNTGTRKIVHKNDSITEKCRIAAIHPNNMEVTDEDYTKKYPMVYKPCPHCYQPSEK